MRRCRNAVPLFLVFVAFVFAPPGHSQRRGESGASQELLQSLPSAAVAHAEGLGKRVLRPGRERTLITGHLIDDRGEAVPMRIMLQLPRIVGLEGTRPNSAVILFDGRNPVHSLSRTEEQLLEIFSSDTAEGMLSFVEEEAAAQLLGRSVREPSADGRGSSFYDIFEVSVPAPSNPARVERLKRYAFDSSTGLLANTQYRDETLSPPMTIDIRFSDWQGIEESAYPGRIDRLENGRLVFSWIATRIQALPRQDSHQFEFPRETGR